MASNIENRSFDFSFDHERWDKLAAGASTSKCAIVAQFPDKDSCNAKIMRAFQTQVGFPELPKSVVITLKKE